MLQRLKTIIFYQLWTAYVPSLGKIRKRTSSLSDTLGQVARLFKGDDVTDWAAVRSDPDAVFVRRMYK